MHAKVVHASVTQTSVADQEVYVVQFRGNVEPAFSRGELAVMLAVVGVVVIETAVAAAFAFG
jgi:hypothetical protein